MNNFLCQAVLLLKLWWQEDGPVHIVGWGEEMLPASGIQKTPGRGQKEEPWARCTNTCFIQPVTPDEVTSLASSTIRDLLPLGSSELHTLKSESFLVPERFQQ